LPVRLPAKQEYGIQGFRRGDAVFYTVRGEPDEVSKLMQELKKWGVPEVIALVRHRAGPRRQDAEDEEQDAEATESDENDKKKA